MQAGHFLLGLNIYQKGFFPPLLPVTSGIWLKAPHPHHCKFLPEMELGISSLHCPCCSPLRRLRTWGMMESRPWPWGRRGCVYGPRREGLLPQELEIGTQSRIGLESRRPHQMERVGGMERVTWKRIYYVDNGYPMGIFCVTQGT